MINYQDILNTWMQTKQHHKTYYVGHTEKTRNKALTERDHTVQKSVNNMKVCIDYNVSLIKFAQNNFQDALVTAKKK
jgi:hypothetical protein